MPRGKRVHIAGGVYHVIVRGIERRELFKDHTDRTEFLSRLATSLQKTQSKCYAWVLMSNHVHLMLRPLKESLTSVMRSLLTGYAVYFNKKHKRHGYVYQNRYKSILCQEDAYFLELLRYIHLNPIRAKVVESLSGLDRYPWSGHRVLIGKDINEWQERDEVLQWFGKRNQEALRQYKEFIKDGIGQTNSIDFLGGGLIRSIGGWSEAIRARRNKEYWRGDERILGDSEFVNRVLRQIEESLDERDELVRAGWNLNKVVASVCKELKIEKEVLQKKGRHNTISNAKGIICYFGNRVLGINATEIARCLGISQPAVSKNITKGKDGFKRLRRKLLSY